ncbi:trimeric intracellular cation channel family protein [Halothiobacillus diazotrophicus]|nr:trimeric intracellular cation channel family protein [Halothiobacillus diazotrophicus]
MIIADMLRGLDFFGTVVFAISGALVAARKSMDWMGFSILATVTGIGGGTLRDLLLGRPVFWIVHWEYIVICVVTALATFYLLRHVHRRLSWLLWADAVGLAAFSVLGVQIALTSGTSPFIAIIMGMMTAAFGGLIRDVLAGEPPLLLHREIYASAALIGGVVYVLLAVVLHQPIWALIVGFVAALIIRGLGIVYHWHLPAARAS